MKKSAFITFAVTVILCFICASFSAAPKKFKGTIQFYGNSPFEYPGLETKNGRKYALEIPEEVNISKKELLSHSGELIEISGYLDKDKKEGLNSLPNGTIIVTDYKLLSEQEFPDAEFRELN